MNWLNVLEIIARVISGSVAIGAILGLLLRDRSHVFENMAIYSVFIAFMVGFGKLLVYAILGG